MGHAHCMYTPRVLTHMIQGAEAHTPVEACKNRGQKPDRKAPQTSASGCFHREGLGRAEIRSSGSWSSNRCLVFCL